MAVTGLLDFDEIKNELQNYLRANLTDRTSRETQAISTQSGDGNTKIFYINVSNVSCIVSAVVDSVTLNYGTDYTFNFDYDDSGTYKCQIAFVAAPNNAVDNIVITYLYGSPWIYSDYPMDRLRKDKFPRVGFDIISAATNDSSLDGNDKITSLAISITAYDVKKEFVDDIIKEVREKLLENKAGFTYLKYITPAEIGPLLPQPNMHNQSLSRAVDFIAPLEEEIVS